MRRALIILLACASCVRAAEPIELPESIAYATLVRADGSPGPLIRLRDGPTALTAQDGVYLYGWTEEQLALFGPPDETPRPLSKKSAPCDPPLPAPAIVLRFEEGGKTGPAEALDVELSADWTTCPLDQVGELWVDNRCVENGCSSELFAEGCKLTLVSECFAPLEGRLLPNGTVCLTSPTCEELAPSGVETLVSTSYCEDRCTIEVHDTALLSPPRFAACAEDDPSCRVRLRAPDVEPISMSPTASSLGRDELGAYLSIDFALYEDRVVVLHAQSDENDIYCKLKPLSIVSYDLDTLEKQSDLGVPACLQRIIPSGDHLFATSNFYPGYLVELDEEGVLVRTATAAIESFIETVPTGLLYDRARERLLLTLTSASMNNRYDVVSFNAQTFEIVSRFGETIGRTGSPVLGRPGQAIVHNGDARRPQWFSYENDRVILLGEGFMSNSSIGNSLYYPPTDSVLYVTTAIPAVEVQSRVRQERVALYMNNSVPTHLAWLDAEHRTVAVASSDRGATKRTAQLSVARFDDNDVLRFEPRIMDIGEGVITKMELDHKGRLWILLSWTGELIRLDPIRAE